MTRLLTGQVLATRIFGGQPPRSRLQQIPWRLVAKVGAVVQLSPTDQPFDGLWLEHWLRDHVIRHIPGVAMQLSELLGLRVDRRRRATGRHRRRRALVVAGDLDDNPSPTCSG